MLDIALLPGKYAVCRLAAGSALPPELSGGLSNGDVVTVSWTADGISLICPADRAPEQAVGETAWRCLRVAEPLDLAVSGTLAALVDPSPQPGSAWSPSPPTTPTTCWFPPCGSARRPPRWSVPAIASSADLHPPAGSS